MSTFQKATQAPLQNQQQLSTSATKVSVIDTEVQKSTQEAEEDEIPVQDIETSVVDNLETSSMDIENRDQMRAKHDQSDVETADNLQGDAAQDSGIGNSNAGISSRPEKRRRRLKAYNAMTGYKLNLRKKITSKTTASTKKDDSTPLPFELTPSSQKQVPTLANFIFLPPPVPPQPKPPEQVPTDFTFSPEP
ncbi:unnamed protein product [Umbelopsis ramanniana]